MRALVTGATGFLGAALVAALVDAGVDVAVIVREHSDMWRLTGQLSRVVLIRGDLAELARLRDPLRDFSPTVVFHLGWHGVGNEARNDFAQVDLNLRSSLVLADLARELGCSAFIGLGSQAEYGPCSRRVNEEVPTLPTTLYGAAKLSCYHLCRTFLSQTSVRFAWLRLFSSYGPRDKTSWMLPYLITTLHQGASPDLTPGEQLWDYIYVDDVCRALLAVAKTETAGGVFNLGSGVARPLRATIEYIRDRVAPSLALGFGKIPYRPDQVMHLEADITRLETVTGWRPQIDHWDGLDRTIAWYTGGDNRGRTS